MSNGFTDQHLPGIRNRRKRFKENSEKYCDEHGRLGCAICEGRGENQ